ncbi:hypothetical protein HAX54_037863 [Datura stramonium]|uniref:Kinesin motor domain-containing protein n=1 Tax=Datura stramonium TaxID=4076 RepID=A0ABS8VLA1_DATST|nr:hypothetical protein [Datura stramonium]
MGLLFIKLIMIGGKVSAIIVLNLGMILLNAGIWSRKMKGKKEVEGVYRRSKPKRKIKPKIKQVWVAKPTHKVTTEPVNVDAEKDSTQLEGLDVFRDTIIGEPSIEIDDNVHNRSTILENKAPLVPPFNSLVIIPNSNSNADWFAYGLTSSEKTHTMRGSATEPGVVLMAVQDLFNFIGEKVDEDEKPIADEAAPSIIEEVKKTYEVEKPTVEAPPSAIIEKLMSTDEEEKQKADEPHVLEIEEVKKAEKEQKPIVDEPVPTTVEEEGKPTTKGPPATTIEEIMKSLMN